MKKENISNKSQTDWKRFTAMTDQDIDLSDIPEIPVDLFAQAVVRHGLDPAVKKEQITIRVDRDVLNWYKAQGKGYQTRINALLRAYMEAHQR